MFFPQAMTEVELIVPEKDLLAVTNVLAGQGVFHQVDASHLSSRASHASSDSWKERAAAYAALERRILTIMQALVVEEGAPPAKNETTMVELESVRPLVEQIEQAVKDATGDLVSNQKKLAQLQDYIRELEPVADVNLDMNVLRNPRYIHSILGIMPAANIERLETSLARTPFALVTLREEGNNAVVWLTGSQNNADVLDRAARSAYLNPFDFSSVHEGTPAEIIKSLNADIATAKEQIEKQNVVTEKLRATYQQQLQTSLWSIRTSRLLADAMAHFGKLKYTYLIVGWIPSASLATLSQKLKQVSSNIIIDSTPSQRGHASHNVPTSLRNPGILGKFEMLVTTYGQPRYEEVDPTVLIFVTFPLLFGAMFGDVGQGIILALFGWLLSSKKVAALRSMASLGTIVTVCGSASILFGFIYGSFFGKEGEENILFSWFPFLHKLVLIEPLHDPILILGIAVGVGAVLLSFGFLLNLYNAFRAKEWARFFFDHRGLVGLSLYWSILGFAAASFVPGFPIPTAVFAVTGVIALIGVIFSEVFKHLMEGHRPLIEGGYTLGGFVMFGIQAGVELFEVLISFLSNTLSYARVGGFALAHAGLSLAVYKMAEVAGGAPLVGILLYWLVVILGNLFIIGFEGMIVGIQTMRLHYYEFFSKFFTGGGAQYEPLAPLRAQEKPQN